jgi:hypothetical protein
LRWTRDGYASLWALLGRAVPWTVFRCGMGCRGDDGCHCERAFGEDCMPPCPPPHTHTPIGRRQAYWMKRKGWGGHVPANVDRCDARCGVRSAVQSSASLLSAVCVLMAWACVACGIGVDATHCWPDGAAMPSSAHWTATVACASRRCTFCTSPS